MLNLVLESDASADSKLPFQLKVSSSRAGSDTPAINIKMNIYKNVESRKDQVPIKIRCIFYEKFSHLLLLKCLNSNVRYKRTDNSQPKLQFSNLYIFKI